MNSIWDHDAMRLTVFLTDSYKVTHWKQYPPGTTGVYSYFEFRGGRFPETVFFGLQNILKSYLVGRVVGNWVTLAAAQELFSEHFGADHFNLDGWGHIVRDHDGRLPLSIKAVLEGTPVPNSNVMMTVENTCPECFWLTNYVETLLVQVWYPSTVATLSREMKRLILEFLDKTGDPALVDYKLQDFGFRGSTSVESAAVGGLAHLVNFKGTDTIPALCLALAHYGAAGAAGNSIPAAEHSTITAWGEDGERDAYRNMLEKYPTGYVAVVSDSYDVWNAVQQIWGCELRNDVLAREGTVVIRPDSGVPHEVVPKILDSLGCKFGYLKNEKGYKVLDSHVRVIQGDGVDYEETRAVLHAATVAGWSTDNIAFGMGGALLQKLNRDTQGAAFKCSSVVVDGVRRDVFKRPVDAPWKTSKKGRLYLVRCNGEYKTVSDGDHVGQLLPRLNPRLLRDELVEVFRDGKLLVDQSFEDVRKRAALST